MATSRLTEQEILFEDMYQNAPCGYHSLDQSGLVIQINNTELSWLGYSREEIVNKKHITDLIGEEGKKQFYESFPRFKKTGFIRDVEFEMIRKDGSAFPVLLSATAVRDQNGNFIMSRATTIDLTERKKVEQAKKFEEDSEYFARITSHDLREPVRNIEMFAELILRNHKSGLDESTRVYLGYIRDGAKRLSGMVESLTEFASQTRSTSPAETINLNDLVNEVVDTLRIQIEENHVEICRESLPDVHGEKSHLFHVFQNLISNAIKYRGAASPQIRISSVSRPSEWEVSISDNGVGFDPRYQETVFMPFKRLCSKTNVHGHGVGLAICKKLIAKQGGRIWAESQQGKGSTFRFTLLKKIDMSQFGTPLAG